MYTKYVKTAPLFAKNVGVGSYSPHRWIATILTPPHRPGTLTNEAPMTSQHAEVVAHVQIYAVRAIGEPKRTQSGVASHTCSCSPHLPTVGAYNVV